MSTIVVTNIDDGSISVPATSVTKGGVKAYAMLVTDAAGSGSTFNHTSITDNGTGTSTHTFTSAFSDTNYGHAGGLRATTDSDRTPGQITSSDATGSCLINMANDTGTNSTTGYDVQWWGDLA